jgi:cellulose synthase/poly-beta-1,6-N-acetylglucosamine synthase-like glycosyltransferase
MSFTYFVGLFGQKFSYEKHKLVLQNFDRQTEVPSVDIYLPSCGEDLDIIENTFKYVSKVRYKGKLNVYVLDDSGGSELDYLSSEYKFNYISRPNRGEWKKAGNIRHAFAKTTGDFLVIFDADFCPRPDFLEETIPYLVEDNRIAILQTPQFFNSYKGQNVIQRGFNYKQELFYRIIQSGRDTFNGAVCTGTNAVYKRKALEPFGGTALMGHSEDMHTGFNCVSAGWKIKYLPLILAKGNTPDDLASYFTQQYRWALGNLELIVSKKFWISHVPVLLKMNYVASILYYAASAIGVVVAILPVILIVLFFPDSVHWYDVALLLPGFVMSHLIQPLWSRARWTLSSIGVSRFVGWSALAAIFDMIRGKEMEWVATGDTKLANKQQRYILYRNLFIFWNLAGLVIVLGGSIVRIFSESFNYRGDSNWLTIMFFASLYCLINLSILFNKKEKTNKLVYIFRAFKINPITLCGKFCNSITSFFWSIIRLTALRC